MEFGVLELGLRNKQIANISCFLKIQVEAFRINWNDNCGNSSFISKSVVRDFCALFAQWVDVFHKVIAIISATLKETVSSADKCFGTKLAKISLQSCFKLLSCLVNEPEDSRLKQDKNAFVNELTIVVEKIRSIVSVDLRQLKVKELKVTNDYDWTHWQCLSTKDVVLEASANNTLPLALFYFKTIRNMDIDWKDVCTFVFEDILNSLHKEDFTKLCNSLSQINISVNEAIYELFRNASSANLKAFLYSKLKLSPKMMLREKHSMEVLSLVEDILRDYEIILNVHLINLLDSKRITGILISPLHEEKENFVEKHLKLLSPKTVWQCLVSNYDIKLLRKWIENSHNTNKLNFPFNWNVTSDFLNTLHNTSGQEYLKENILCFAASKGLFCGEELKFVNVTIRRLLRATCTENTSIILDTPSHPLKKTQGFNFADFQQRIVDNALQNNLFHFLYWFSNSNDHKRFLESSEVKSTTKEVLQSYISWKEEPTNCLSIFNSILMTAKHVYPLQQPLNVQTLLDCGLSQLAVLALQYLPSGLIGAVEADTEQLRYANRNALSTSLKINYPLLYQAFSSVLHSSESNSFYTQDSPSIYTLLKDTTVFDVSKLFLWQNMNSFRNGVAELPSFSDIRLAAKYGFKANLTSLYYLNKGRPIEAYSKWVSEKALSSKQIEATYKKACLLAFYNCSEKSIASACVVFVELLRGDSSILRLHLSVANLIMSYSAHFVGFELRKQLQEIGNLLKRCCFYDDRRAAIKLYELMVAAFTRKYDNRSKSMLDECFEYKMAIKFCKLYRLDSPVAFMTKCAQNDDWLLFTLFAQMYEIPNTVILKLLVATGNEGFNNKCIAEHLGKAFQSSHVFHNSGNEREHFNAKDSLQRSKDTSASRYRNTLLQRIGVKKKMESSKLLMSSNLSKANSTGEDDRTSVLSDSELTNVETSSIASGSMYSEYFDGISFDLQNPPKDLFSLVLQCQKCNPVEPWKPLLASSMILSNPVAALIAASVQSDYEMSNLFDCFCCWLFASFDFPLKNSIHANEASVNWAQREFISLIKRALVVPENYRIFFVGLEVFKQEDNPLAFLIRFLIEFLEEKEFHTCVKQLRSFQKNLLNYVNEEDSKFLLNSRKFIEEISVVILSCALKATSCSYQLHVLLQHLDSTNIQSAFRNNVTVPDFHKMYRLSQCLESTSLDLNVSLFLDLKGDSEEYRNSLLKFVFSLQEEQYFNEAIQFASICNINSHDVCLNEWTVKAMKRKEDIVLWKEGLNSMENCGILEKSLLQFGMKFVERINSLITKSYVLIKLLGYLIDITEDQREISYIEKMFWQIALKVEMSASNLDNYSNYWSDIWALVINVGKNMDIDINYASNESIRACLLREVEILSLDVILGKLFNAGCIEVAFRVAQIFHYCSRDLDIVFACHSIAIGAPQLSNVCASLLKAFSSSDFATSISNEESDSFDVNETLEKLSSMSTYGESACQRILLYSKISNNLGITYSDIFKERDEIGLLRSLISSDPSNKTLNLAKELITLTGTNDECVAQFISLDIFQSISTGNEPVEEGSTFDGESCSNFLLLLRLLNNPSVLGKKLLEFLENGSIDNLPAAVAVEICIKAHDCFTLSSDVEGIAVVLRNVKNLVMQNLSEDCDYHSMIRLLKGIGRYSEMTYIFDILKESDNFEMLLGKGIEKVPQLRIALLDSMKSDKEMYPLIALNFSMHREIAEMMEMGALKTIKNIHFHRQQGLTGFRTILDRVLHELIDASESYTKAGRYTKADSCAKIAELIALQISYLPSGLMVLNLPETAVSDFVSKHPRFAEALIVAEAYQHHRSWDLALFKNVVVRGDWNYFREFSSQLQLTTTNFDEIVALYAKYKLNSFPTLTADKQTAVKNNVQKLLSHLDDIQKQYQYSVELDLNEYANSLLQGENGAFLRDLKQQNQI